MSAGNDSTLTISKSCAESERKSKDNIKVKTTFFIEYRNSITNAAKITDFALWEVTKCYFMKKVRVSHVALTNVCQYLGIRSRESCPIASTGRQLSFRGLHAWFVSIHPWPCRGCNKQWYALPRCRCRGHGTSSQE